MVKRSNFLANYGLNNLIENQTIIELKRVEGKNNPQTHFIGIVVQLVN